MTTIRLNTRALEKLQKQNGWSDEDLCKKISISRTQIWRLRLPHGDPRYNVPGETFIANVLKAFPDKYFEDLFFLDKNIASSHNQNETHPKAARSCKKPSKEACNYERGGDTVWPNLR